MKQPLGTILVVDDDEDVLTAAKLLLKQAPYIVLTEKNPASLPILLKNETVDIILLDMNFTRDVTSGVEGFHWLQKILEIDPSSIVILITAYGDIETAIKAVKAGAIDFVLKPWQNEKLLATLSSAMQLRRSRSKVQQLEIQQQHLREAMDQPFHEMIGTCSVMQRVFQTIEKVAATDANILILGENGTGKELVARAIHRRSQRVDGIFISVDIGAVPESLFESELFGHVKGAFTDAQTERAGKFEAASGGTLFLDEIGNLSLSLQAKLLRVLETRQVVRVGSNKPIPFDIRLICATNKPIHESVNINAFRQDFLYRINTVEIHLPPLRERREDIPLLVDFFIELYSRKCGKPIHRMDTQAYRRLEQYAWPGNVRELQHTIERAVILHEGPSYQSSDFILDYPHSDYDKIILDSFNLEEAEKIILRKALTIHHGNVSQAAEALGLTRTSLYRRMEKYGL
ncbi:MAG: sigma-54 dependent transcriptional regulator [Bacteroidota bacterium]|jgi:DNA-binding NtrC family response regulator